MRAGKNLKNCQWFILALIGIYMWAFIIGGSVSLIKQAHAEMQIETESSGSILLP